MKSKLLPILILLTLFSLHSQAQMMPITHYSGTAMYGSRAITTTSGGSVSTIVAGCLGPFPTYHNGSGAMGYYHYAISAPVYSIYIDAHGLNSGPLAGGESIYVDINGSPYALTAADIVSYSNCGSAGAAPSYLSAGTLYGPMGTFSWSHYNGGIIKIDVCSGITSFAIYCNGIGGGAAYNLSFDSVASPGCMLTATNNGPLCANDTLKLFAAGSASYPYSWSGPAGFSSLLQNPVIPHATLANSGTYTVTQTAGGITYSATTTVIINAAPSITASSNSPVCEGDVILLTASPAIPGCTYSWTGPAAFYSPLQNPSRSPALPAHAGTYSVIATLGSCSDTAHVSVVIKSIPVHAFSANAPICAGADLFFSTSPIIPGASYSWAGPNSFSSSLPEPAIPAASLAASGIYTVTTSFDGCDAVTLVAVTISPQPDISVVADTFICTGQTLHLSAAPGTYSTYSWTGPNSFSASVAAPTRTNMAITDAGTYIVIVGSEGCFDTAEIAVTVKPKPELHATCDSAICEGDVILFTAGPAEPGKTFTWYGPHSYTSTLQNPTIPAAAVSQQGTYFVIARQDGCTDTSFLSVIVNSVSQFLSDTLICLDKPTKIKLTANVPDGAVAIWSTGDVASQITVADTGRYWVSVKYLGCTGKANVYIRGEICDCDIVFPNAFTPNADGTNDFFRPIIPSSCFVTHYTLAIYNRWGQQVFFTHNPSDKWDGMVFGKQGELGVYMYFAKYTGGTRGGAKMLKGDLSLVR